MDEKKELFGGLFSKKSKSVGPRPLAGHEEEKGVKILGTGCANCEKMFENVQMALWQIGVPELPVKVRDYQEIASYGVMSMPALVVDGKLVAAGRVLSVDEAFKLLQESMQK